MGLSVLRFIINMVHHLNWSVYEAQPLVFDGLMFHCVFDCSVAVFM